MTELKAVKIAGIERVADGENEAAQQEGARFDMLVMTGLSAGVWASPALARDADRSRARIFSRDSFSSVSAGMALSSAVCARSSVSLKLEKKTSY